MNFNLSVETHKVGENVILNQQKYIQEVPQVVAMANCKPSATPTVGSPKLEASASYFLLKPSQYRSVVSKLQYLCATRPDIMFAVSKAS